MSGLYKFTDITGSPIAFHAEAVESVFVDALDKDKAIIRTRTGAEYRVQEPFQKVYDDLHYWLGGTS
jgi:hypothetical protein